MPRGRCHGDLRQVTADDADCGIVVFGDLGDTRLSDVVVVGRIAIAARMAMIATTIISSIRVKPDCFSLVMSPVGINRRHKLTATDCKL